MARHFANELNFVLGAEKQRVFGSNWVEAKSTSCEIDRCNIVLPEQRLRAMSKEVMTSFPIIRKLR